MVATEIRRDLEYKDIQLSDVTVTGKVTTQDGKLYGTLGDIIVKYPDGRQFSFRLYQKGRVDPEYSNEHGIITTLVKNTIGVEDGMNDNLIIEEFKSFVKQDLGLIE